MQRQYHQIIVYYVCVFLVCLAITYPVVARDTPHSMVVKQSAETPVKIAEKNINDNQSKPVIVAIGYGKPPYIFEETNQGYFLDIITTAFKNIGREVRFAYLPTRRLLRFEKFENIDAIGGTPMVNQKHCQSTRFMQFQNVIVYDREAPEIKKLTDLRDYSLAAFQNAKIILGPDFTKIVNQSPNYYEMISQRNQVRVFLKKRFNVAIIDRNIFTYWMNHFRDTEGLVRPYKIARLFDWKTNMGLEFKDPKICQLFNQGLAQMEQSGALLELRRKYRMLD